ncbi:MAG: hypothetical protein LBR81_00715 [Prevotellaceae bacterium]|jgi:hypothetical protein|nr:hypothetical protein [Prevotellaceae bacterium]
MKNILIACGLLLSLNLWAQREKKLEHLLNLDTAQVVIQDADKNKIPYQEKFFPNYGDTLVTGSLFMENDGSYSPQYNNIRFDEKTNSFILSPAYRGFVRKKAHFEFNSNVSLGWVNRLPERQSDFGQNATPDNPFSWGAPIDKSYNPYNFFQASLGATNSLTYSNYIGKNAMLNLRYTNSSNRGVVPEASSMSNDFFAEINNIRPKFLPRTRLGLKVNYLFSENNLTENGNNYSRLFYDIATTPPDFKNSKSFTNLNGTEQRYTGSVDNPYRYVNNSLDEESRRKASIVFSLKNKKWDWTVGYDYNRQHIHSGIAPYADAMTENITGREETIGIFNSKLQYTHEFFPSFKSGWWKKLLRSTLTLNYNLSSTNYDADYTQTDDISEQRITNDLGVRLYNNNNNNGCLFFYNFWANTSTSNTLNDKKVFFNEGLILRFQFNHNSFYNAFDWDNFPYGLEIRPRYSLSRTHNESPLYYSQPHYASTLTRAEDFRSYQEQFPLFQNPNLALESTTRQELGLDINSRDINSRGGRWGIFEVNYFWDKTTGGILPVYQNNRFELTNAVDWNKEGLEITYKINGRMWRFLGDRIYYSINANFTSYKTMVNQLLLNTDHLALAGFSDVSISVLEGERYGVIYGQKADGTQGVIGDPTPDYELNLNLDLNWRKWSLKASMGYVHGGDVWNGTLTTMNYLGVSAASAANRTAQNPADSPYYSAGISGIAENAIEDASTLRLHNISLSYDFSKQVDIPELTLSLGLNNLILWSAYSGIDPARPLFGYAAAQGLDYFNMPGTTNVSLALSMKF